MATFEMRRNLATDTAHRVRVAAEDAWLTLRALRAAVTHGLRGLVYWLPFAWRWRPWDSMWAYDALIHGLRALREHEARCRGHERWKEDVESLDLALTKWQQLEEAPEGADRQVAWEGFHDHLKADARGWWC